MISQLIHGGETVAIGKSITSWENYDNATSKKTRNNVILAISREKIMTMLHVKTRNKKKYNIYKIHRSKDSYKKLAILLNIKIFFLLQ